MPNRNQRKSKKSVVNINFKRQKEIFDPQIFQKSITIAGIGNIGSQTAIALARLGLKDFYLYDHDIIKEHNLSSQAFGIKQLNLSKVDAIKENIIDINKNASVLSLKEKYNGDVSFGDILIVAVDSMKERKRIWKNLLKNNIRPELIIDGRVGGLQLEIYTCKTLEEWEDTFVDNPSKEPCGGRFFVSVSMTIGALISNQIIKYLTGKPFPRNIIFNFNSYQIIV